MEMSDWNYIFSVEVLLSHNRRWHQSMDSKRKRYSIEWFLYDCFRYRGHVVMRIINALCWKFSHLSLLGLRVRTWYIRNSFVEFLHIYSRICIAQARVVVRCLPIMISVEARLVKRKRRMPLHSGTFANWQMLLIHKCKSKREREQIGIHVAARVHWTQLVFCCCI